MAVTQTPPPETSDVHVGGDISGQVAVGKYIVQIRSIEGGRVNLVPSERQPRLRPLPRPVLLRPSPFPDLLDREPEVGVANAALRAGLPVEFHAEAGMGKTSLLRYLAYYPFDNAFPDGVVYRSARRQAVADLLHSLVDAFYESNPPRKFSEAEIRRALSDIQALILLDDVGLTSDEVAVVMDAMPRCAFLLASPERHLWGEGRSLALGGLPLGAAMELVERELGRSLAGDERAPARALWRSLDGHPLRIVEATGVAREQGCSIGEVVSRLHAA